MIYYRSIVIHAYGAIRMGCTGCMSMLELKPVSANLKVYVKYGFMATSKLQKYFHIQ